MKNHSRLVAAILAAALLITSCAGQNAVKQIPGAGSGSTPAIIRIGIDPNLAPFEILDGGTNEFSGFDVDVIKTIAAKAQIKIELVKVINGYNQVLKAVENCELDAAISAIPISDALKQKMNLTDPYYSTTHVLTVKKGNTKISGLDTLSGMMVGTQIDTPSQNDVQKIQAAIPKYYDTFFLAFEELINGNIDAVVADAPRAFSYVNVKPNNLKIVGAAFGNLDYGIAVCKNKTELLKQLNDGLASMKADGTLENLKKKWLSNFAQ